MKQPQNWMEDRLGSAVRGENPAVMLRMKSGFAVFGDTQFLPGYCLLLRYPQANSLNELTLEQRAIYLTDMALIGDAIIRVCQPARINYSILMNTDHYLHAHIEARYDWEPEFYRSGPSWRYPREERCAEKHAFTTPENMALKQKLTKILAAIMKETGNE